MIDEVDEEIIRGVRSLARERDILYTVVYKLSQLINKKSCDVRRGSVCLKKMKPRKGKRQDFFNLVYWPNLNYAKKLGYVNVLIATGGFRKNKVTFCNKLPEDRYLNNKIIPALKRLFTDIGFNVSVK